jgi:hypothetical protein
MFMAYDNKSNKKIFSLLSLAIFALALNPTNVSIDSANDFDRSNSAGITYKGDLLARSRG